jgi:hypothetical protein
MNSSSIKLAPTGIWTSQLVAWGDMTAVIDRVRAHQSRAQTTSAFRYFHPSRRSYPCHSGAQ